MWKVGTLCRITCSSLLFIGAALASETQESPDSTGAVMLPSGLEVEFNEMLWNEMGDGLTYRFRFVAPKLLETEVSDDSRTEDMKYLCEEFALPRLSKIGPKPTEIVVSMADKKGEFGIYNPEITEFFEMYKISENKCTWELY